VSIAMLIVVVLFACLALPVLRALDASRSLPDGLSALVAWLRPVRVVHLVIAAGLLLALLVGPSVALFLGLVVVALYLWTWVHEFLFLMSLSDADFPGRFDKAIWATVMIATGPLGLWTFRRYRAARWVETTEPTAAGSAKPATAHDWF
jgi:hypothetical protein